MSTPGLTILPMRDRAYLRVLLLAGVIAGGATGAYLTHIGAATAARNGSGTYSLPAGNPVVSGASISSTWANNTLSDIGTELTNSLDRAGRGAMTGPLQSAAGAVSAPGLTFSGDTDTGIYRIAANNAGIAVAGVKNQEWSTTGSAMTAGLTITQSQANTTALTTTGTGSGNGVVAAGGATSGVGVVATGGAPNGNAYVGTGDGTGAGANGTGGDTSGPGGQFTGGAPNGHGVVGDATGVGIGVVAYAGTDSTSTTRYSAITASNGDLLITAANPNSDVGFSNTLTGANMIKAWIKIGSTSAGTISAGFNIASIACSSNTVKVDLQTDMLNTAYVIMATTTTTGQVLWTAPLSAGQFEIGSILTDGATQNLCTQSVALQAMVIGPQ